MAVSKIASLGIKVDSKTAVTAKKDLSGLTKQAGVTEKAMKGLGTNSSKELDKVSKGAGASSLAMKGLAAASSALVASLALSKLADYADTYTTVTNRLKQATSGTRELAQAQSDVSRIAQSTLSELDAVAQLYGKLGRASEELGLNQKEVARTTETITKAIKLSGASTAEANSAITQLAQALAAGAFRGDEFNSVAESAPRLLEILKTELGATTGELRDLSSQGELTADVLIKAFANQAEQIDIEFQNFTGTISASFNSIAQGFIEYTGAIDQAIGGTEKLSGIFAGIGRIFSEAGEGIRLVTSDTYKLRAAEDELAALFTERLALQQEANSLEERGLVLRTLSKKSSLEALDEEIAKVIEKRDALLESASAESRASLEAKAAEREQLRLIKEKEAAQRAATAALAEQYTLYGEGRAAAESAVQAQIDKLKEYYSYGTGREEAVALAMQQKSDEAFSYIAAGYNIYAEAIANAGAVGDEYTAKQIQNAKDLAAREEAAAMGMMNATLGMIGSISNARSRDSEEAFKKNQDLQKGLVVINSGAAVMMELATNPDPFGKWFNTGKIIATGISQLANISSASYGGGGSVGGISPGSQSSTAPAGNTNHVSIEFSGAVNNPDDVISALSKYFDNDGILFDSNSAQGSIYE